MTGTAFENEKLNTVILQFCFVSKEIVIQKRWKVVADFTCCNNIHSYSYLPGECHV